MTENEPYTVEFDETSNFRDFRFSITALFSTLSESVIEERVLMNSSDQEIVNFMKEYYALDYYKKGADLIEKVGYDTALNYFNDNAN